MNRAPISYPLQIQFGMLNQCVFRIFLVSVLSVGVSLSLLAQEGSDQQDLQVANHYFEKEEYDKAVSLYKELYNNSQSSEFIYKKYLKTLLALENFNEAEELVEEQMETSNQPLPYKVDLGYVYEKAGKGKKAQNIYEEAINQLSPDEAAIDRLATAFELKGKENYTLKTYQMGNQLIKGSNPFNYNLGRIYANRGQKEKMITAFLDVLKETPDRKQDIKNVLQDQLTSDSEKNLLKKELYSRIQKYPDHTVYNELLIWLLAQQKEFDAALKQAIALDKRLSKQGQRVMEFADLARSSGAYTTAISAYEYVMENGGMQLKLKAEMELLDTKKERITRTTTYTKEDLITLRQDFKEFLDEYGQNANTADIMQEWAKLEAFYLDSTEKAVEILEKIKDMPQADEVLKASAKLTLGDIYLVNEKIWDAILLYSQVDKAHKEATIGKRAKFKKARAYYFMGDFEWSQTQLDILKGTTTDLIANDALELSTFITDNLGMDTVKAPLRMYSQAELYLFQHKYEEAYSLLDKILERYPGHDLTDDIYFQQSEIKRKQGKYQAAADLLEKVIDHNPTDILADDALFKLAQLYDEELGNKEKAKELYRKIVLNYDDSIYAVHARKRYRSLRGDSVN